MLLPWAAFLKRKGYLWNDQPDRLRAFLIEFLREDVACLVAPDQQRGDGLLVETTGASPLSKSSLGVLLAALTSLYETLSGAGYYAYPNPMRSERMSALKREHVSALKNAGAPDSAGIREETWAQTNRAFPTNQFRQRRGKVWEPELVLEPDEVQQRMRETIDFMIQHVMFQRDQVILLLLRQTGARLSEVVEMTVLGYRKAQRAGHALVKSKGSHGREEKTIYFTQTVDRLLARYIRTERACYDPQGRKRLDQLEDHDPLFLTRTGKPYNRFAFYYHWRKLFEPSQHQFQKQEQVEFSPHDLRHLRVTRAVATIRKTANGDASSEAALLEGFQHLMGWRSPKTMATYIKTMNKRQELVALLADEEEQERAESQAQPILPASIGEATESANKKLSPQTEIKEFPSSDDNNEFGWYEDEA